MSEVIGPKDQTGFEARDKQWTYRVDQMRHPHLFEPGQIYVNDLLMFRAQRLYFGKGLGQFTHDLLPSLALTHANVEDANHPHRGGPSSIKIILGGKDSHEIEITRERARHLAEILLTYADTGDLIDARSQMP